MIRKSLTRRVEESVKLFDPEEQACAFTVFKKLKEMYGRLNDEVKITTIGELFHIRIGKLESMNSYLKRAKALANDINAGDKELTDYLLCAAIIGGLPSEYRAVTRYLDVSKDKIKLEVLEAKLNTMSDENQMKDRQSHRPQIQKKKEETKTNKKCYNCGKPNHKAADCWNKKRNEANATGISREDCWILDSAATAHMTGEITLLQDYKEFRQKSGTRLPNGTSDNAIGQGTAEIMIGSKKVKIKVLYIPTFENSLISTAQLSKEHGYSVEFNAKKGLIRKGKLVVQEVPCVDNLFLLRKKKEISCNNVKIIHQSLGHASKEIMRLSGVKGVHRLGTCKGCNEGEHTKTKYSRKAQEEPQCSEPLERIHVDLFGPTPEDSFKGHKHFIGITDDATRFTDVCCLKTKDEAEEYLFDDYIPRVENITGKRVQQIKVDGAGELNSNSVKQRCKKRGIVLLTTNPYAHEQNAIAERFNRTIMKRARASLHQNDLDVRLWNYAVIMVNFVRNILYCKTVKSCPWDLFQPKKKKPKFEDLFPFGCAAYVRVPTERRNKLEKQSKLMTFIGYTNQGYLFWDHEKCNETRSRDAKFLKQKTVFEINGSPFVPEDYVIEIPDEETYVDHSEEDSKEEEQFVYSPLTNGYNDAKDDCSDDDSLEIELSDVDTDEEEAPNIMERKNDKKPSLGRVYLEMIENKETPPPRQRGKPPSRFDDYAMNAIYAKCPKNYDEAKKIDAWNESMDEELRSITQHEVWDIVYKPKNAKILPTQWIYSQPKDAFNNPIKCKSRFVVNGNRQIITKEETYSPVIKEETKRIAMTIATYFDLESCHIDIKTAFLHGEIDREIFIKPPPQMDQNIVLKLKKALYGLKNSPRLFYLKIKKTLTSMGFKPCSTDECLLFRGKGGAIELITVHVDDFGIYASNDGIASTIGLLKEEYDVKVLGPVTDYLAVMIARNRNKKEMFLSQPAKIDQMLQTFGMEDCKPVATPLDVTKQLMKPENYNKELWKNIPYQNATATLLYISRTRPDISTAASILSKFNHCYTNEHWKAVKRVMRYLKGTRNHKLRIKPSSLELTGYADADWAADKDNRRSRSGYCFYLGDSLISWRSCLQQTISTSTMEAEYKALAFAIQEMKFLRMTLESLGFKQETPTVIYDDNQACIKCATNAVYHGRAKHIEIDYHVTREAVKRKLCKVIYCNSDDMKADIFTKVLSRAKHQTAMKQLNVIQPLGGESEEKDSNHI